jgi:glycosyltransferase involved in cell wall biosynthesis
VAGCTERIFEEFSVTMTNTALIIGPTAPPHNGMTRATELVLKALGGGEGAVVHLDTADRRGLSNVGKFDFGNLYLAARHGAQFLRLLLSKRPRVVYVPIAQAWLPFLRDCLFLVPARVFGRKVIVHLHGGHFGRFYAETSPLMRWIIRFALGDAACSLVLGKNVEGAFEGILPAEKIRVVPNGIPDIFPGGAACGQRNRSPVLLYLSGLDAQKGTLDLLRALSKVRERVGELRVIFAGEWFSQAGKESADRLIGELGLERVLEFVGPVGTERKRELLRQADLFILPSLNEGQPYAILEAMCAELPVVTTSVGCIPEMIRNGVEGFLITPGDIEALADRIAQLLADEGLREKMGLAGRERFLERYSYERFAEDIKAVFAEVLREGQGAVAERARPAIE